ncbi:hypothetical protein [Nostoc sp. UHCC 0252]|nr:hypothetical protein [Nostoc sp. UHCC 0252]MEA5604255.1 hypothetical protein [Nostoc sp. UHCC 0252]
MNQHSLISLTLIGDKMDVRMSSFLIVAIPRLSAIAAFAALYRSAKMSY